MEVVPIGASSYEVNDKESFARVEEIALEVFEF